MPSIESRLEELVQRGEELRRRGEPVSAEELCRDCPELVMLLRARLEGDTGTKRRNDTTSPSQTPARSQDSDDLHIGSEPIPGYKLVLRLGRGGYGEVWKSIAPGGFAVALKFVPLATEGLQVEQRALDIIRTLRHPCLLTTVGSWQTGRHLVIAMELADRTLKDRFQEAVRQGYIGIPRDELLEYFHEAARGLDFLNEPRHPYDGQERVSFQHRDIKPENILLVGGGAKVADFGLVRLLEQAQTSHTGSMTPIYAAPEFFEGHTSQHSDQYSLAITYCHLRGGRVPFVGSLADVMRGHLEEAPDLSMLPPEERPIVARALAKVPTERWPNCATFVSQLRNCPVKTGVPAVGPDLSAATYKRPAGSQATPIPIAAATNSRPAKRRGLGLVLVCLVAVGAVVAVQMNDSAKDYLKELFAEKKTEEKRSDDKEESKGDSESTAKKATETNSTPVAAVAPSATTPANTGAENTGPASERPGTPVAVTEPSATLDKSAVGDRPVVEPPKVNPTRTAAKLEAPALLNPDKATEMPAKDDTAKPPAVPTPAVAATPTATPNPIPTPTTPPTPVPTPAPAPTLREAPLPEPKSTAKTEGKPETKTIAAAVPATVTATEPAPPPPPLKAPFNEAGAKNAQQAWAAHLGRPVVETNSIGMELTLIPPGEFTIGMDTSDVTRPPHAVPPQRAIVRSPFSMGTTEVTQGQWFHVMQTRPWVGRKSKNEDDLPAAWISWTEANQFCVQLTTLEQQKGQLAKEVRYQLPSEAEWEWSCRAGTTGKFSCADAELVQHCWYESNSDGESHPVRKLKPNPFGLYDMHGNMTEWCRDNFLSPATSQPASKGYLHGGNWKRTARHCASAARDPLTVDSQHSENGFRIVKIQN